MKKLLIALSLIAGFASAVTTITLVPAYNGTVNNSESYYITTLSGTNVNLAPMVESQSATFIMNGSNKVSPAGTNVATSNIWDQVH